MRQDACLICIWSVCVSRWMAAGWHDVDVLSGGHRAQGRRDADTTPSAFETFLAQQPDLSPKAWPRYVLITLTVWAVLSLRGH
jgi:hypothetical protein